MSEKRLPYREKVIEEALVAHADSLASGSDNSARLLVRYKRLRNALEGLFGIAERLRDTLSPVDPSESFVAELRSRLADVRRDQMARAERRREARKLAWQIAGMTGLILSGLAMVALGVGFIISLLSRRRATTTI